MAKELLKKQNVSFYKEDEELWNEICRLAEKEKRPVQNYILNLLYQVVDISSDVTPSVTLEDENRDEVNSSRDKIKNLIKKSY